MIYQLYRMADDQIDETSLITEVDVQSFENALTALKRKVNKEIRERAETPIKIMYSTLRKDTARYGENVRYVICAVEDDEGYEIEVYKYALMQVI